MRRERPISHADAVGVCSVLRRAFHRFTVSQEFLRNPSVIDSPTIASVSGVHYRPPTLIALPICNFVAFVDSQIPRCRRSIGATCNDISFVTVHSVYVAIAGVTSATTATAADKRFFHFSPPVWFQPRLNLGAMQPFGLHFFRIAIWLRPLRKIIPTPTIMTYPSVKFETPTSISFPWLSKINWHPKS